MPSSANGVVGLKPTYSRSRVSRYGVIAMSPSLDHVGPMARRVADAAIMFDAISGTDPQDPTSLSEPPSNVLGQIDQGIKNLRIGLDRTYALEGIDRGQAAALENAVKGVVVEPAPSPPFKVSQPQFSLEFLIIAFDDPAMLGHPHQLGERDLGGQDSPPHDSSPAYRPARNTAASLPPNGVPSWEILNHRRRNILPETQRFREPFAGPAGWYRMNLRRSVFERPKKGPLGPVPLYVPQL